MLDFHLMSAVQELQSKLGNLEKDFNEFKKEAIKAHNELVDHIKEKEAQQGDYVKEKCDHSEDV